MTDQTIAGAFKQKKVNLSKADSGLTRHFTHDVTSEPEVCLQGQQGSIAFNLMRKNDSVVGGIISSYKNPIQSNNWSIEELPEATPKEIEVTEILNEWFFKKQNFDELLNQILGMLPMGFSCFEKFFQNIEINGNKYMLPVLAERVQQSIRRIDYVDLLVEQQTTRGALVYLPFDDMVFFTFRKEANDLRGVSLLRQAYNDFLDKKEVKSMAKKGMARSMLGLATGIAPEGTDPRSQAFTDFADMVIELGERGYNGSSDSAVMQKGYELGLLTSTFDLKGMKDYIAYLDSTMLMSVLTQFLALGQSGGGGSYSLGRDQSDMLLDGMQYITDYVGKSFSQQVIYDTVRMNWSDVDPFKFNIKGTNLQKKNSKEFAETLKILVDSNAIILQSADEVRLRKMYDLPEIDLEDRERKEKEAQEGLDLDKKNPKQLKEESEKEEKKEGKKTEKLKLSENWKTAKQRNVFKDQEVVKLSKFSRASLQLIADEFSKVVRRQLNKGTVEAQGLKDLQISNIGAYKKRLSQKLSGIANDSWKNALKNSKGKLKLAEIKASDLPSKVLTSYVVNQSDLMVEKQINDLREAALLAANTEASKGLSVNNTMAIVDEKMDNYIASKNRIEFGADTSIVQAMNYSEMQYYKSIENDLWGFRFANDEPVTQICKSLVGKTYKDGSSAMDIVQPPLHGRCDSFFIPIYKSDFATAPELDNFIPSDEILKQKTI